MLHWYLLFIFQASRSIFDDLDRKSGISMDTVEKKIGFFI